LPFSVLIIFPFRKKKERKSERIRDMNKEIMRRIYSKTRERNTERET
jgi:hypothetical protein